MIPKAATTADNNAHSKLNCNFKAMAALANPNPIKARKETRKRWLFSMVRRSSWEAAKRWRYQKVGKVPGQKSADRAGEHPTGLKIQEPQAQGGCQEIEAQAQHRRTIANAARWQTARQLQK